MYDYSFDIFLIVMGLLLALIFLGVGVCIGKGCSKNNNKDVYDGNNNSNIHTDDDSNNTNSTVGDIHG